MTWAKIDDQLHSHPKVTQAWQASRASLGLYLLALSHSSAYLTDGVISAAFVRAQLPAAGERKRAVAALVDAALWDTHPDGFQIHNYLEFNESRDRVTARRRADSIRKNGGSRVTHG